MVGEMTVLWAPKHPEGRKERGASPQNKLGQILCALQGAPKGTLISGMACGGPYRAFSQCYVPAGRKENT